MSLTIVPMRGQPKRPRIFPSSPIPELGPLCARVMLWGKIASCRNAFLGAHRPKSFPTSTRNAGRSFPARRAPRESRSRPHCPGRISPGRQGIVLAPHKVRLNAVFCYKLHITAPGVYLKPDLPFCPRAQLSGSDSYHGWWERGADPPADSRSK